MKVYLKNIAEQLKNYSLSLDKKSIFIDKPWALIDEEFELQKLIFKKNKELILSKNGRVHVGKWDYFPEAKSLLIDRVSDKILCNEAFIDKGVMILKLDGINNRFFILANENLIPDLDAFKYLKKLRSHKLKIKEIPLVDGRRLEIQRDDIDGPVKIGYPVTVNAETINDGLYKHRVNNKYYEIKNSRIYKILDEKLYTNLHGDKIHIQQQEYWKINNGDYVFVNGEQVDSLLIDFNKTKNLIVRDGKVLRFERKNPTTRGISKAWKSFWGYYHD